MRPENDGKATELEGILPIPAFDDVFDEEAVDPGNKDLIPGLQAVYRLRPEDFLAYHPDVEAQTLSVELRPADPYTEEQAANWLECFWDYRHIDDDMPQYRWDGKQFVK